MQVFVLKQSCVNCWLTLWDVLYGVLIIVMDGGLYHQSSFWASRDCSSPLPQGKVKVAHSDVGQSVGLQTLVFTFFKLITQKLMWQLYWAVSCLYLHAGTIRCQLSSFWPWSSTFMLHFQSYLLRMCKKTIQEYFFLNIFLLTYPQTKPFYIPIFMYPLLYSQE